MVLTSSQAIAIFHAICFYIDGKEPSTHAQKTHTSDAGVETHLQEYWVAAKSQNSNPIRHDNPHKSKRTEAYLRAYLALSGDKIPAKGIHLAGDKFLYLDKGVIKSLLIYGLIFLENGVFSLTARGRDYLTAPLALK